MEYSYNTVLTEVKNEKKDLCVKQVNLKNRKNVSEEYLQYLLNVEGMQNNMLFMGMCNERPHEWKWKAPNTGEEFPQGRKVEMFHILSWVMGVPVLIVLRCNTDFCMPRYFMILFQR